MNKNQAILASALVSGALIALSATPASATAAYADLYGSFATTVSVATGYSKPTIDHTNALRYQNSSRFDAHLAYKAPSTYAQNDPNGLLFMVDPAGCMKTTSCANNGTETATIGTTFSFYSAASGGTLLGTITDSAIATFVYTNDTDNLCWQDSAVTSTTTSTGPNALTLISHTPRLACNAPGSKNTNFGFEQIVFELAGNYFQMDLYDWNDWNESPKITFAYLDPTNVPEPASVTVLGAGLLGFGALLRRRRKKAA